MNPEIILWLALVVVFILVELATTALVSIWLVAGAVAALLVSLFTDSWTVELAVFAVVSAVALAASRPLARRLQQSKAPELNAGRNIGRVATVVAEAEPGRLARVRLDGVRLGRRIRPAAVQGANLRGNRPARRHPDG